MRGLAQRLGPSSRPQALEAARTHGVLDILDRRLDPQAAGPIAVAFSGGADSLYLLASATRWAQRHGRPVLALTLDHRLQPASAGWSRDCAAVAARLGAGFRGLAWDGLKPETGLPAAARQARHRLLAAAAREAGARAILFGHTASDVAEGEVMRREGSNLGRLRQWSPSPSWPEGRGLFCLRPMLALSRQEVRARLAAEGWDWIDDPANEDLGFARPRARARLATADVAGLVVDEVGPDAPAPDVARRASFDPGGALRLARAARTDPRLLQIALLCVSGGEIPARGRKVAALAARIDDGRPATMTLGGCTLVVDAREIVIARAAGEARRGGLAPLDLPQGRPVVWDGRFELTAARPGLTARTLAGLAARLPKAEKARLSAFPAAARGALPAIVADGGQDVTCPILAEASQVRAHALAPGRLVSACDLIAHEADANRLAHGEFTLDVLSWAQEWKKVDVNDPA